jgi:acetyl esterase/lipase
VSVEYRLAPEYPFPAAHDDGWEILDWLKENAASLGIDATRLAVGGSSAGAALAAGVALRARDEGLATLAFVLLQQPVIDHLSSQRSARAFTDTPFLKAHHLPRAWSTYFGASQPEGRQLSYAAPFAADDLSNFPPTFILVGNVDPARDEALAFAQRLIEADVEVELHLFPGVPHGFELIEGAPATRNSVELRVTALARTIGARPGA